MSKSFSNARVHAQSFQGRVTCSLVLVLQEEEKLKDKPISNHIIRQHIENIISKKTKPSKLPSLNINRKKKSKFNEQPSSFTLIHKC